jgi:hypothetical protein
MTKNQGWNPMDTAPKDGREILARRHNGVFHQHYIVWWAGNFLTYPWMGEGTAYTPDHMDEWHEIPSSPTTDQRKPE